MRQKNATMFWLLMTLVPMCVVMGLVQGLIKEAEIEKKHFSVALSHNIAHELVPEDVMRSLQPLFVSGNIGMLVGAVNQFDRRMMHSLASIIVSDSQSALSQDDKLSFLLMLAHRNSMSKVIQYKLFDLMMRMHLFNMHSPVLFGVAKKDYMGVLPSLISWVHREKSALVSYIEEKLLIDEAYNSAVEQDDLGLIERLSTSGIRIDSQKASDLLVHVVYDRKKSIFIPFLINRGANVNCIGPDRYTLLSKAVFYNDFITTRILLEAGADADLQVDETIGSARQIARVSGNKDLEKLLNRYVVRG